MIAGIVLLSMFTAQVSSRLTTQELKGEDHLFGKKVRILRGKYPTTNINTLAAVTVTTLLLYYFTTTTTTTAAAATTTTTTTTTMTTTTTTTTTTTITTTSYMLLLLLLLHLLLLHLSRSLITTANASKVFQNRYWGVLVKQ